MLRSEVIWFPRFILHLKCVLAQLRFFRFNSWVTWIQYETIRKASECESYRELNQLVKDINEEAFTDFIQKQVEFVRNTNTQETVRYVIIT